MKIIFKSTLFIITLLSLTFYSCDTTETDIDEENPISGECFDFKDVTSLTGLSGEVLYTHFIDNNHGWVLARRNISSMNLFQTDDGGETFTLLHENFNIDLGNPIFPILKFINETDGFTNSVIGLNKASYTTDKGVTWTIIPNPAIWNNTSIFWTGFDSNSSQTVFMADLSYVMVIDNATKAITNAVEMPENFFDDSWHLVGRDIHLSESGVITCLFDVGNSDITKIGQSSDYGATWSFSLDIDTPNISSMNWPTDQIGYFNSSDKLYKTINGGLNWEIKESLHFNSIDFVNENLGLGIVSSGPATENGFYKTIDGGDTWTVFDCLKPDNTNHYRTGEWISYTSVDNAILPGFESDGDFGGDYGLFYYKGE